MAISISDSLANATKSINEHLRNDYVLNDFLKVIADFSVQVKNNYEVSFPAFPDIKFFATSISLPLTQRNFTELYFHGRKIDVPLTYDNEHVVNMTFLNDGHGYMYKVLRNLLVHDYTYDAYSYIGSFINSITRGDMYVKCYTGHEKFSGQLVILKSVRLETISGLSFGNSESDLSTFDVQLRCADVEFLPGVQQADYNIETASTGKTDNRLDVRTQLLLQRAMSQ